MTKRAVRESVVKIASDGAFVEGNLSVPEGSNGLVIFAHGSGSSRFSPRNAQVARKINSVGLGTLLIDLLTAEEEEVDEVTAEFRFDIDLLAKRLVSATEWVKKNADTKNMAIGYYGASTGAAAALIAAARLPEHVKAVVSRGGRPDLAVEYLSKVMAPTLLIVGGNDPEVLEMNKDALRRIRVEKKLEVVPGATHLFEEPGKLEEVARLSIDWFLNHL